MPLAREAVAEACAIQRQRRTGERICHGEKTPFETRQYVFRRGATNRRMQPRKPQYDVALRQSTV